MTYLVIVAAIIGFVLSRMSFRPASTDAPAIGDIPREAIGNAAAPHPEKERYVVAIDPARHVIVVDKADPDITQNDADPRSDALASFYRILYGPGLCSPE